MLATCWSSLGFAPWNLSGTVYGALLNHAPQLQNMGDAVNAAPYKSAPQFPVLQVRPRNTLCASGSIIGVPNDTNMVEIGLSLGIVIGQTACHISESEADSVVAGYIPVVEICLPSNSHYRPNVRLKARDGFTVMGHATQASANINPDNLATSVTVNSQQTTKGTTGERVRHVAKLIAAVTEFMTLHAGDVLLLGSSSPALSVCVGDQIQAHIEGIDTVQFTLVQESQHKTQALTSSTARVLSNSTTPSARVVYGGAIHSAQAHNTDLKLDDGRIVAISDVQWLPPFEVGTILALGLNYADHLKELSKELTVSARDEPLVFIKGPGTLIGHCGNTRRPANVQFMHYECELAVVIGKTTKHVSRQNAMAHVAGYTVCNDYAIRDYLENWYRPNLRVKNRDGATVLGPWFVPAALVPDPHKLRITTRVNDKLTQDGTTANMINDIPALIEYLSSFMTLQAGDVILTGTPEGVVNVNEGDEVVCEIENIGRLVNTIVGDDAFGR
jgi:5-oxopent-3-ene-1,2,5-tricarboxylate decarboxylase/2-hydroxyhepta-2,4-diene-1,7-dioate isomerase